VSYSSVITLTFTALAAFQGTMLSSAAGDEMRLIQPDREQGMSAAVVVNDCALIHTGQVFAVSGSSPSGDISAFEQTTRVLDLLNQQLQHAGSGLNRCVKLNFYLRSNTALAEVRKALAVRFSQDHQPAVSFVTTPLPHDACLVAADAVCTTAETVAQQVQITGDLAVVPAGSRIYIAGQAEQSESLSEATRRTLQSLSNTMKFLGRQDADIAQLKAFVMPMADHTVVAAEVKKFFGDASAPPLVMVEWQSSANTPVEIELVGWGGAAGSGPEISYATPPGMTTSPVYSRVATIRGTSSIYVSGIYADELTSGMLNDPQQGEREVKQSFATLQQILSQAGGDLRHLVKATYYVTSDAAANLKLNELRPQYYDPKRPPAASKAIVSGVGADGRGITMDMIAIPVITATN
jgi:enamine deaminase RidA (YjgF/YER057c/UK114 family)